MKYRRLYNFTNILAQIGNTIGQFLAKSLDSLRREFGELRSASAEQLMFIKEDVILPQHYTFHELIVMRARGKSGPLFSFDVHNDVRLVSDASLEKDETHAGKVSADCNLQHISLLHNIPRTIRIKIGITIAFFKCAYTVYVQ